MSVEQGQYTDCLNCDESVDIDFIDNMDDEVSPLDNTITMTFKPCKACGFVTVLEYLWHKRYTMQSSEAASNEHAGKNTWYCQVTNDIDIGKEEDE